MAIIITLVVILLALIGVPIYSLMGAGALFAFKTEGIQSTAVIIEMLRLASLPALMAIPLFTLAGYMLAESKTPQRMLCLSQALLGWLPGGFAGAALCATALFTAFTGASGVTIIALGGLIYPMLKEQGYPEKFNLGLLTTTGSLGLLFPPSLPIILYGLVAGVSIDSLFRASAVPGVMLLIILTAYAFFVGKRAGVKSVPFKWDVLKACLRNSIWEIPLPFIIIGGIYGGLFTAPEAATIMAFYVLIMEVFIYKEINLFKDLPKIITKSMILVGAIFMVLGTALGFTNYCIDIELPDKLFSWLQTFVSNKIFFLVILNAFLLVINMIEIFSAIIIVVPIIVPIAAQYGIDPVHLGVIFLLNLEIGYMTPPFGLNLFLANSRFNAPLTKLYGAVIKFWLMMIVALLIVTYFPALSLWTVK